MATSTGVVSRETLAAPISRLEVVTREFQQAGGRIAVGGGPRVGKSYLGDRLEAIGIPVYRTDFLVQSHAWSEASAEVARWMMETPPSWVAEGVAVVRALRKICRLQSGRPCDLLVWMRGPRVALTSGQAGMYRGCETIFREIRPELERRGVEIMVVG